MSVLTAFLAVGFGETVGQVLLIRELLVNFQGNELSLGVIFACWFLLTALGSWGLGRCAWRLPARPSTFFFTVVLYVFILICQLLLARLVNPILGVRPGEVAGLVSIIFASVIVLTPLCLLHGFQFPLACHILSSGAELPAAQVGRVYIVEALGSMAGGALFTYVLIHYLNHVEIAVVTVLLNLAAGFFLLNPLLSSRHIPSKALACALSLAGIVFLMSGSAAKLDTISSQWQWQGHELVSSRNSVYQNIAVTRSGEQLNFYANGVLLFIAPVPDIKATEEISHFPLLYHPAPKNVLLIGGSLGGVLDEVAKHPVHSIVCIEPDPSIIETARQCLPRDPIADSRVKVEYTDARLSVERTGRVFDVVIMNLSQPATLQLNRFYTREFFESVRDVLTGQGIFALVLPSAEAYMGEELRRLNRGIFTTLKEVFPQVIAIPDDATIFLASPEPALLIKSPEEISRQLKERNLSTRLLTQQYIEYKLLSERVAHLTAYLYEAEETNLDHRPVSTFHTLALWNVMFYPALKGAFDFALRLKLWWLLPFCLLFLIPLSRAVKERKFSISLVSNALLTTGFAGMTFAVVVLFAFQASYGYLYHRIGVLTAAFMLGAALGGWFMNRVMGKFREDLLVLCWIELGVVTYALLLPWVLLAVVKLATIPGEVLFSCLNLAAGFITGMEFPLASKICLRLTKNMARVTGLLYAADLWGAVLGAALAAVLLIPVLGVASTCALAATFNLVTFAALFAAVKAHVQAV